MSYDRGGRNGGCGSSYSQCTVALPCRPNPVETELKSKVAILQTRVQELERKLQEEAARPIFGSQFIEAYLEEFGAKLSKEQAEQGEKVFQSLVAFLSDIRAKSQADPSAST